MGTSFEACAVIVRQDASGETLVECDDPLLVRADILVVDRERQALGAVVDGVMQEMGPISADVFNQILAQARVVLTASHFSGGTVGRKVDVVSF